MDIQKRCTKCGITKNVGYFRYNKIRNYYYSRCCECIYLYQLKYRKLNKDYIAKRNKEYQQTNKYKQKSKNRYEQLRTVVLNHYTNNNIHCQCEGCLETHLEFMSIDHIDNDGAEHRKKLKIIGGGSRFLYWLKRNDYPKGFKVLCMNCNTSLGFRGYCPHEKNEN